MNDEINKLRIRFDFFRVQIIFDFMHTHSHPNLNTLVPKFMLFTKKKRRNLKKEKNKQLFIQLIKDNKKKTSAACSKQTHNFKIVAENELNGNRTKRL